MFPVFLFVPYVCVESVGPRYFVGESRDSELKCLQLKCLPARTALIEENKRMLKALSQRFQDSWSYVRP